MVDDIPEGEPIEPYRPPPAPKPVRPVGELIEQLGRMPTHAERLRLMDEDEVINAVTEGVTLTAIAKEAGVSLVALREWLSAPSRSARYVRARQDAAQAYDERAEQVLLTAPATPVELARARELAHHYRWRAKVVNPATYGDKVQATVTHDVVAELRDVIHQRQSRLPIAEKPSTLVVDESGGDAKSLIPLVDRPAALTPPHSLGPLRGSDDAA